MFTGDRTSRHGPHSSGVPATLAAGLARAAGQQPTGVCSSEHRRSARPIYRDTIRMPKSLGARRPAAGQAERVADGQDEVADLRLESPKLAGRRFFAPLTLIPARSSGRYLPTSVAGCGETESA